jgi:hypothetical protein
VVSVVAREGAQPPNTPLQLTSLRSAADGQRSAVMGKAVPGGYVGLLELGAPGARL